MILLEKLAALVHEQWALWTRWLLDNLDEEHIQAWERQIATPYEELSESEKDRDREWAKKVIDIYQQAWDDLRLSPYERAKPDEKIPDEFQYSYAADDMGEPYPQQSAVEKDAMMKLVPLHYEFVTEGITQANDKKWCGRHWQWEGVDDYPCNVAGYLAIIRPTKG